METENGAKLELVRQANGSWALIVTRGGEESEAVLLRRDEMKALASVLIDSL